MGIHAQLTDDSSFDPEAIEEMARAFDQTCIALNVFAGDENGRQIVATRIVDLARRGVMDAKTLRDRVIQVAGRRLSCFNAPTPPLPWRRRALPRP